jgi:heptaprenyl diphosphate synthase
MRNMNETRNLVLLSLLVALAVVLRGIEGIIPNPLPWVRIGLANIMTLLAILLFGVKLGFLLTVLRVFIASLLFGTFLSPTFILSFTAGIVSTLAMGFIHVYLPKMFSPIGISVFGGFTHNLVQLFVAYLLIVKHLQIFYLFPILALIGILSGFFNGWIVILLYKHILSQMNHLLPQPQKEPNKKTCIKKWNKYYGFHLKTNITSGNPKQYFACSSDKSTENFTNILE